MLPDNCVQHFTLTVLLDFHIPIQTSKFPTKTLIYDVVQP